MPKAVLHQPLGPLICYKGCRHTEDTQLSKLRYITAFHNTPPSSIRKDEKGGRSCRPSSKAPTNCQQELPPARPHRDRQDTPAQQPAESPPARPAYPAAPRPCRETATSTTVTGTPLSQRVRTLHCGPARGPQRRLDPPTLPRQLEERSRGQQTNTWLP